MKKLLTTLCVFCAISMSAQENWYDSLMVLKPRLQRLSSQFKDIYLLPPNDVKFKMRTNDTEGSFLYYIGDEIQITYGQEFSRNVSVITIMTITDSMTIVESTMYYKNIPQETFAPGIDVATTYLEYNLYAFKKQVEEWEKQFKEPRPKKSKQPHKKDPQKNVFDLPEQGRTYVPFLLSALMDSNHGPRRYKLRALTN